MRYIVVLGKTNPTFQEITSAEADLEFIGMEIYSTVGDCITCSGGYFAGKRLKVMCPLRGWTAAGLDVNRGPIATAIMAVVVLTLLLLSLYGSIVAFRCHKEVFGQDITVGEITVLAIAVWLCLIGVAAMSINHHTD